MWKTDGRVDRGTDRYDDFLTVAFRNFANTPKNASKNTHKKHKPTRIWVIMEGQLKETVNRSSIYLVN